MKATIDQWINSELVESISHAVIHSSWQGLLIGLITLMMMRTRWVCSPSQRYKVALLGIVSLMISVILTFVMHYYAPVSAPEATAVSPDSVLQYVYTISDTIQPTDSKWIGYAWMIGVLIFLMKFLFDFILVQYVRYTASDAEELADAKKVCEQLQRQSGVKHPISIRVSHLIGAPMTMGFWRPIIIFPIGLVNQLTIDEVESILAHELGHIVRKDYLINLLISLVEVCLFYHPLVWWLSRLAKREREYCCDDYALRTITTPLDYIKTLVKIQELSLNPNTKLSMSFARPGLLDRVKRLLKIQKTHNKMKEKLFISMTILALLVFCSKDMIAKTTHQIFVSETDMSDESSVCQEIEVEVEVQSLDTIPQNHSYTITKSDDQSSITIRKEDGEIKELIVDGKTIPSTDYEDYQEQIDDVEGNTIVIEDHDGWTHIFGDGPMAFGNGDIKIFADSIDFHEWEERFQNMGGLMENWSESWEGTFDDEWIQSMEDIGERFGNSFQWHMDGDSMKRFEFVFPDQLMDEEAIRRLEESIEGLEFPSIENKEMMRKLQELMEGMELPDLLEDEGMRFYDLRPKSLDGYSYGSQKTVEDKIGYELRKDRLIENGQQSEIELTGKHMKINGEKQPSNIWKKYKSVFEEASGIQLSKDSKLKFNVQGKRTIKKSRSY